MDIRKRGFTLVELAIVVVIIGLLAALAVPVYKKTRNLSQATRIANDFKKVEQAFDVLLLERVMPEGVYSEGSTPGGFPLEDLPRAIRSKPLGSDSMITYNINAGAVGSGNQGVVLTESSDLDDSMLLELDEILDDGDTGSGQGTKSSDTQYVLIVGQI